MQKLTLTYAETRRLYGKEVYPSPVARFIGELPEECVEEVRLRTTDNDPVKPSTDGDADVVNDSGYKLGQRVRHAKFAVKAHSQYGRQRRASPFAGGIPGPGY